MKKIIEILEVIENLQKKYKEPPNVGANNSEISLFKEKYSTVFNDSVDKTFIDFVKVCNGLEFNSFKLYSIDDKIINGVEFGIFQLNKLLQEIYEMPDFIFFGDSSQDLFVYNKKAKQYELLDRYSSESYKIFDNMEEMIKYILERMLNS